MAEIEGLIRHRVCLDIRDHLKVRITYDHREMVILVPVSVLFMFLACFWIGLGGGDWFTMEHPNSCMHWAVKMWVCMYGGIM